MSGVLDFGCRFKMQKLPIQSAENKFARRIIYSGLIVLVVLAVSWAVLAFAARVLPRIAVAQIGELTNTEIRTGSLEFNFNGLVIIKNLQIRPKRKCDYDNTILKADKVYARFAVGSLIILRPRLKQIRVDDFVFDAQYDTGSKRWNLSDLTIVSGDKKIESMPQVRLEDGLLQCTKVHSGRLDVVAAMPVDAEFWFDRQQPQGYRFELVTADNTGYARSKLSGRWKPGMITVAGAVSSINLPGFDLAWNANILAAQLNYEEDRNYLLKLSVKDFVYRYSTAVDESAEFIPAGRFKKFNLLLSFLRRYSPSGKMDAAFQASGNFDQLNESSVAGTIHCKNVSICDRKFPYKIEHLNGQIDFNQNGLSFDNLSAEHGRVKLAFDGRFMGFGPDREYQIRISSDNMALDDELYKALSKKRKNIWSAFSPSGFAAVDYRIDRDRWGGIDRTLTVEPAGAQAAYHRFAYPLKNISGKIFFDNNNISVSNLVSEYAGRRIKIDGRITGRYTEQPKYDFQIEAENIPLDSVLGDSLPAGQKHFYDSLDINGLVDGSIRVFSSSSQGGSANFNADVDFKKASLRFQRQCKPLRNVFGKVVFTPGAAQIEHLKGRFGSGMVQIKGDIGQAQGKNGQLCYDLSLTGKDIELNDDLTAAIPESMRKIVSDMRLGGKINGDVKLHKGSGQRRADYDIKIDCLGASAAFKQFNYPLKNIKGRLEITNSRIELKNITAVPAGSISIEPDIPAIKVDGQLMTSCDGFGDGRLRFSAENLMLDEHLGAALTEPFNLYYEKLCPTGRFDMNFEDIRIRRTKTGQRHIVFDGDIRLKNYALKIPGNPAGMNAFLKIGVVYETGSGFRDSRIAVFADNLKIAGKSLANLKTDIRYDKTGHSWNSRQLIADFYGGTLMGKLDFRRTLANGLAYSFQTGFTDVDLKKMLSGHSAADHSEQPTSGTVSGSLAIGGDFRNGCSQIGRCRLKIKDMRVGRLSPLARLLYVLKLTRPEDFAFDRMVVDSYIEENMLFFELFDLSGKAVAFTGSGKMNLNTSQLRLTLAARGQRLATAEPSFLQSLTEGLGHAVIRIEVTGDLYNPEIKTTTWPVIRDSLKILGEKDQSR